MNMKIHDSLFCKFESSDGVNYECSNCGNRITVHDRYESPPMFPCANSLQRDSDEIDFATKVKNFGKSVVNHAVKGFPTCTEEQIIKRHNICMSCPFMKDNTCTKCGCPITRNKVYVSKLAWADQECPEGKWPKEI